MEVKIKESIFIFVRIFFWHSIIILQPFISSNSLSLPMNNLLNEFNISINNRTSLFNEKSAPKINNNFNILFNMQVASNTGHSNIDNSAEFYAPGSFSKLISARVEYSNQWLSLEVEPYIISQNDPFFHAPVPSTYQFTNNHGDINILSQTNMGFRQSRVILHYRGIGVSYGHESHWWSPGFHSAIALSSNAPSQETYSIGTFSDLRLGNLSLGAKIIIMPYESSMGSQLYYSGLNAHVTHSSNSAIITLGLHRTYLSGNFGNLLATNNATDNWTFEDAARLVIEPLFGQNKRNLDYTIPGTPGFDAWDEVLTGYVKLTFPNQHLEVYADLASDDNRGNLIDLKAHWDHTLGYMLGFKKFTHFNRWSLFAGVEYLTTRVSNTFKPDFYRGSEPNNYYSKPIYDYFTYQGRRMGAHSGSSSNDLIFLLGIGNQKSITFFSYNKEHHGIKSMEYPELKTELALTYHRNISKHYSIFITLEYESIQNYGFIDNKISESKLLWLGYSFFLR